MPRNSSRESASAAANQATASSAASGYKQAARRVVEFFATKKRIQLKHAEALELVAIVHGARNWQTLQGSAQAAEADLPATLPRPAWPGHSAVTGATATTYSWLAHQLAVNVRSNHASLSVVESEAELEAIEHALGNGTQLQLLTSQKLIEIAGQAASEPPSMSALRSLAEQMHHDGQWVVSLVGSGPETRLAALSAVARLCRAIFQLRSEQPHLQLMPFTVTSRSGKGVENIFEQGRSVNMRAVALCDDEQGPSYRALVNVQSLTVLSGGRTRPLDCAVEAVFPGYAG